MTAFRDETAPRGNRDNAIRYQGGEWLWLDNAPELDGKPWLDPTAEGARRYLIELAVEAVQAGVSLIVMDAVQFADNSNSPNAGFAGEAGTPQLRQAVLREFVAEAAGAIEAAGGVLAVYYPVTDIASTEEESGWEQGRSHTRFGGSPLDVIGGNLVLGVLSELFGEGEFSHGGLVVNAGEDAGQAVLAAIEYVKTLAGEGVTIIPLVQGGAGMGEVWPVTDSRILHFEGFAAGG
jgi:hypothetical protein